MFKTTTYVDLDSIEFDAFYAGMDALVDWVREDPESRGNNWDPGYLGVKEAKRLYKEWKEG